jgi:predicted amidohydrolase
MNSEEISGLVGTEIRRIVDGKLVARIRELLVAPYAIEREWDYGPPGQRFTCWTVLEYPFADMAIAYCAEGFGPSYPWGLVHIAGSTNIGMDASWYASLEDAIRNSVAWNGPNPEGYEVQ